LTGLESFELLLKFGKLSFLRKQESIAFKTFWIPACAGMTAGKTGIKDAKKIIVWAARGKQRRFPASDSGFTLLELLVSMTLLALIVAITMGAMRLGSRSVAAGEKKMEDQERLRTVLSMIDAQIQSQVPLTYEEEGNPKYYFRGDARTLRFSTNYSIWGGRRGYVIVEYKVEADDSGKDVLHASEQIPGMEGRWNTRLIDANGISFDYFYRDPTEPEGKWMETLSEGSVIPEKVRIRMVRKTGNISLVLPFRVRRAMASVQGEVRK
jgi:prepilin-type N-terminal cleavage/methylation domain-containing protein